MRQKGKKKDRKTPPNKHRKNERTNERRKHLIFDFSRTSSEGVQQRIDSFIGKGWTEGRKKGKKGK
jgi:hypothetical protein